MAVMSDLDMTLQEIGELAKKNDDRLTMMIQELADINETLRVTNEGMGKCLDILTNGLD